MTAPELHSIRQEYIKEALNEKNVNLDPIQQFISWMNDALHSKVIEPSAMTVATVSPTGQPSARIVLLKNINNHGFVFFTNYNSQKGKDLSKNNKISLLLFWPELERQIRVEGKVEKIPFKESEVYFHSRPVGSQIAAVASPQSEVIVNREVLLSKSKDLEKEFKDKTIEMPKYWGGYVVVPDKMEFWQGGANRLHDRIVYTRLQEEWKIQRLAP